MNQHLAEIARQLRIANLIALGLHEAAEAELFRPAHNEAPEQ